MTIAIHVDQDRDTSCLGASEAPGVLGLDKRNPPIKIWRRHRGLAVDDGGPIGEWAEWGQILEPVIRGKYAVVHHAAVWVPEASEVRDGWLRCTPDGIAAVASHTVDVGTYGLQSGFRHNEGSRGASIRLEALAAGRLGLVQCKNVDTFLAHEWQDGPPPAKEVQARVELAVTGLPWCDLAALIGGNRYVEHRVERDLEIEGRILRDLAAFWDLVQRGVEPTLDHSDQWRLHVSEKMPSAKMVGEATGDDGDAMSRLRRARAARVFAQQDEKLARNDILLRMSARAITAIKHPELGTVSAFRKGNSWQVRCPPTWGDDE